VLNRIQGRNLPPPTVPLSQGVLAGGWLYVSGMVARRPEDRVIIEEINSATRQCLDNVLAVVEAAGGGKQDIVKLTVYLARQSDYAAMNAVFTEYFDGTYPARTTIEAVLGLGPIEIDGVAYIPDGSSS
jgi:2-iminobutanoate/2-iminopropanoate deaminase